MIFHGEGQGGTYGEGRRELGEIEFPRHEDRVSSQEDGDDEEASS